MVTRSEPSGDPGTPTRRAARSDGIRTRSTILATAVELAAISGLDGLSIGVLAEAVGISKSGVYAHFRSKEALQLATVDLARQLFIDDVVSPAFAQDDPLDRLRELGRGFVRHVRSKSLAGGCFFVGAAAEVGPQQGPVHDRVAEVQREWSDLLAATAEAALAAGRLDRSTEPRRLAFRLGTLLAGSNVVFVLQRDPTVLEEAALAIEDLLEAVSA